MSLISSLHNKDATVAVEFPEIEGFFVDIKYAARDELMKIRNRCLTYKFSKRTRQREEEVDNDKFLREYSRAVIKGWKGLKIKHLATLLPVNLSNVNLEEEIPYTEEDALDLLTNSTVFDQFVTDTLGDFEHLSNESTEKAVKN